MPDERQSYDFQTGTWVSKDFLSSPPAPTELPPPAEPPEAGRWLAPVPPKTRNRWEWIPLAGTSVLVAAGFFVQNLNLVIGGLVPSYLFFLFRSFQQQPTFVATPKDLALIEDPDDLGVALVEIDVFVDRKSVGKDRGIAWIADGMLLFSGHRTSFALGGEDLVPPRERAAYRTALGNEISTNDLPLRHPGTRRWVAVHPLSGDDERRELRFAKRLAEFRRNPPPSTGGPRQWPPFEI